MRQLITRPRQASTQPFQARASSLRVWLLLGVLLFSLLGFQALGLKHAIDHSTYSADPANAQSNLQTDHAYPHQDSSSSCHLYDAITLAAFIASANPILQLLNNINFTLISYFQNQYNQSNQQAYQSRAPPAIIL